MNSAFRPNTMVPRESTPLITVIVAVFNGAATLRQCMDSVVQQTYLNKELIVIDGGSRDGTVELLKEYNEQLSYWVSEPDTGIYNAWNKALKHAHGEWICFLGADDFLVSRDVLSEIASRVALVPPEVRVVYTQTAIVDREGVELYKIGQPWEEVHKRFLSLMCLPHTGLLHHRALFAGRGCFDESFRIQGDYEFLLRELRQADAIFIPDIVVAAMRQGGISSNPANALSLLREGRRAQRMHGLYWPRLPWLLAVARVLIRVVLWNILGEARARRVLDWCRQLAGKPKHWTHV